MSESTNPKKEGTRIYEVIMNRDPDVGATVVLVSAGMGGVKTSMCLSFAEKIMDRYPNEKVFWRESLKSPVQFKKIIGYDWKILVEEGYDLVFKNIKTNMVFKPDITYFRDFDELISLSKYQTLNVVFLKDLRRWKDFIEKLNNEPGWFSVIMDEIEDVFPSGISGDDWHWAQAAADVIKQCRKGLVTLIGNVHKGRAIDYRILDKVMIHLYGFGAKPDDHSRIRRTCLDSIKRGEFWIEEEHTRFGYVVLRTVHKPVGDTWTISDN